MEFLTEVLLNVDDETLIEFRNINEDTETLLTDDYIVGQRVEYRGYTKKAWRDLVADYPELRLSCLHYLDYTVIGDQLDKENYLNIGLVLEEILIFLYLDHPQARYRCFHMLITYSMRRSMWLVPEIDQQTGVIQQWTPLKLALVGPNVNPDQWILNPMLVESIMAVLKFVRTRVTSTHELQSNYQYIERLWSEIGYSGSYSEEQIHQLSNLLFWFWIPDPESDDKPDVPTAWQFFGRESIIFIICNSEHEALMDLLIANQPILETPNNCPFIYRCSVGCPNLIMLRKLIRAGHLQNGNLIIELNNWVQKHRHSHSFQIQERIIVLIREILDADYTAETFKKIWNDSLLCNRVMNAHWPDFHRLYLITYSWVFEQRVKDNEDVSNMYLSPEFIHGINRTEEESLLKMLDFVEYPISIRVSERNGPRAFCERMLVKLGWLSLEQASLATRLHFHPKVSQVEYWSPNLE